MLPMELKPYGGPFGGKRDKEEREVVMVIVVVLVNDTLFKVSSIVVFIVTLV